MSAFLKLDDALVKNRLGWSSDYVLSRYRLTPDYFGLLAGGDFAEIDPEKLVLTVNAKLTVPLDCSIDPLRYIAVIAPNPKLYEVAEVSCAPFVIPGTGRVRPVLHLRGLKKFDVSEFDYLASIHLID